MLVDRATLERLLATHAPLRAPSIVPELALWHAEDELPLWQALEDAAGAALPPPYFALAWPAGQALARLILDGDVEVAGLRVVDAGCGSGVAGLAAAKRGAEVVAFDSDPLAIAACELCAAHNGLSIRAEERDVLADPTFDADLVLAADLIYHRAQVEPALAALALWKRHATVLLADGGRPHFDALRVPENRGTLISEIDVPATRKVEGAASRRVRIYR